MSDTPTPTKDLEEFGDGEGEHDPRVQEELERLNKAGGEINELETKLTQARNDYRTTLQVCRVENTFSTKRTSLDDIT